MFRRYVSYGIKGIDDSGRAFTCREIVEDGKDPIKVAMIRNPKLRECDRIHVESKHAFHETLMDERHVTKKELK